MLYILRCLRILRIILNYRDLISPQESMKVKPAASVLSSDRQYPLFRLLKSMPNCCALQSSSVGKKRAVKKIGLSLRFAHCSTSGFAFSGRFTFVGHYTASGEWLSTSSFDSQSTHLVPPRRMDEIEHDARLVRRIGNTSMP